jgi:hypothetical protein
VAAQAEQQPAAGAAAACRRGDDRARGVVTPARAARPQQQQRAHMCTRGPTWGCGMWSAPAHTATELAAAVRGAAGELCRERARRRSRPLRAAVASLYVCVCVCVCLCVLVGADRAAPLPLTPPRQLWCAGCRPMRVCGGTPHAWPHSCFPC